MAFVNKVPRKIFGKGGLKYERTADNYIIRSYLILTLHLILYSD
jgi:hypothetical protein